MLTLPKNSGLIGAAEQILSSVVFGKDPVINQPTSRQQEEQRRSERGPPGLQTGVQSAPEADAFNWTSV